MTSSLNPEQHNQLDIVSNQRLARLTSGKDAASTLEGATTIAFVILTVAKKPYSSQGYPFRTLKTDALEDLIRDNVDLHNAIKKAFSEGRYASVRDMGEWLE